MKRVQLYDDSLDFEENKKQGPFGDFAKPVETYKNKGEPAYDFFGTPIYSPFGIAAGPLPTTRFISAALNHGFDIVTLKSVRTDKFPLNPFPQVRPVDLPGNLDPSKQPQVRVAQEYKDRLAIANSFGIPSVTPAEWQPMMRESFELPQKGQALLVAFQGTARGKGREEFVQDHVKGIQLIKQAGGKVIEINLSCPNEGEAVLACFDTEITTRIVSEVRKTHPDIKLIIKVAYFADKDQLKKLVRQVGPMLDGISPINTMPAMITDNDGREVFPGRPTAGVSGAPIKWAGLEMTRELKKIRDELDLAYKIIGIGGVLNADDFHEYLDAGADIVMSVTGAMWNPNLAKEIKASL